MTIRRHVETVFDPDRLGTESVAGTLLLAQAEQWMTAGTCAQTDPDAFFPDKGGSTRDAKQICRACPVRSECLNYALDNGERFGVWGGMSERERRRYAATARTVVRKRAAS